MEKQFLSINKHLLCVNVKKNKKKKEFNARKERFKYQSIKDFYPVIYLYVENTIIYLYYIF